MRKRKIYMKDHSFQQQFIAHYKGEEVEVTVEVKYEGDSDGETITGSYEWEIVCYPDENRFHDIDNFTKLLRPSIEGAVKDSIDEDEYNHTCTDEYERHGVSRSDFY